MLPDRVSNPGPLTYEVRSPTALAVGTAARCWTFFFSCTPSPGLSPTVLKVGSYPNDDNSVHFFLFVLFCVLFE